nr:immunoglobulin heavy chain junction region [Macaca mulatta]MOW78231.1 immunoglobulin heavy chain junction region [Macaca mulatta]MOW78273.1 immunoglobulin heavy chain junction region [Macaca mulatta]MOW79272.1 immunoglobulin heavy chain junction region [Macaca mulatta]MOW79488.1 immunoglobulin heavy chain junction region [Macaca mulatta]
CARYPYWGDRFDYW